MFDLGAQFGVPIVSHQYFWSGILKYVEIRNHAAGGALVLLRRGQVSSRSSRVFLKVSRFKYF